MEKLLLCIGIILNFNHPIVQSTVVSIERYHQPAAVTYVTTASPIRASRIYYQPTYQTTGQYFSRYTSIASTSDDESPKNKENNSQQTLLEEPTSHVVVNHASATNNINNKQRIASYSEPVYTSSNYRNVNNANYPQAIPKSSDSSRTIKQQFQHQQQSSHKLNEKQNYDSHYSNDDNDDDDDDDDGVGVDDIDGGYENDQEVTQTRTYEIRRPGIQKQFYDIEEKVIVRPVGSALVELDQPQLKERKNPIKLIPSIITQQNPDQYCDFHAKKNMGETTNIKHNNNVHHDKNDDDSFDQKYPTTMQHSNYPPSTQQQHNNDNKGYTDTTTSVDGVYRQTPNIVQHSQYVPPIEHKKPDVHSRTIPSTTTTTTQQQFPVIQDELDSPSIGSDIPNQNPHLYHDSGYNNAGIPSQSFGINQQNPFNQNGYQTPPVVVSTHTINQPHFPNYGCNDTTASVPSNGAGGRTLLQNYPFIQPNSQYPSIPVNNPNIVYSNNQFSHTTPSPSNIFVPQQSNNNNNYNNGLYNNQDTPPEYSYQNNDQNPSSTFGIHQNNYNYNRPNGYYPTNTNNNGVNNNQYHQNNRPNPSSTIGIHQNRPNTSQYPSIYIPPGIFHTNNNVNSPAAQFHKNECNNKTNSNGNEESNHNNYPNQQNHHHSSTTTITSANTPINDQHSTSAINNNKATTGTNDKGTPQNNHNIDYGNGITTTYGIHQSNPSITQQNNFPAVVVQTNNQNNNQYEVNEDVDDTINSKSDSPKITHQYIQREPPLRQQQPIKQYYTIPIMSTNEPATNYNHQNYDYAETTKSSPSSYGLHQKHPVTQPQHDYYLRSTVIKNNQNKYNNQNAVAITNQSNDEIFINNNNNNEHKNVDNKSNQNFKGYYITPTPPSSSNNQNSEIHLSSTTPLSSLPYIQIQQRQPAATANIKQQHHESKNDNYKSPNVYVQTKSTTDPTDLSIIIQSGVLYRKNDTIINSQNNYQDDVDIAYVNKDDDIINCTYNSNNNRNKLNQYKVAPTTQQATPIYLRPDNTETTLNKKQIYHEIHYVSPATVETKSNGEPIKLANYRNKEREEINEEEPEEIDENYRKINHHKKYIELYTARDGVTEIEYDDDSSVDYSPSKSPSSKSVLNDDYNNIEKIRAKIIASTTASSLLTKDLQTNNEHTKTRRIVISTPIETIEKFEINEPTRSSSIKNYITASRDDDEQNIEIVTPTKYVVKSSTTTH